MALIRRISRLFHADMNAVLDQIEEPEILLKQSIRDMQEMLDQEERQINLHKHELKQLSNKEQALKQTLMELEEQLPICFKSEKDDLARSLIQRKLEIQQSIKAISLKINTIKNRLEELEAGVKEQHIQLEGMKQKAEIFSEEEPSVSSDNWSNSAASVQQDDVEIAFLQEKQKWSAS